GEGGLGLDWGRSDAVRADRAREGAASASERPTSELSYAPGAPSAAGGYWGVCLERCLSNESSTGRTCAYDLMFQSRRAIPCGEQTAEAYSGIRRSSCTTLRLPKAARRAS